MSGELVQGLPAPRLREVLTEVLSSDSRELPSSLQEGESGASRGESTAPVRSAG